MKKKEKNPPEDRFRGKNMMEYEREIERALECLRINSGKNILILNTRTSGFLNSLKSILII